MSQKKNYHTIEYGNKDGDIKFGHIHSGNTDLKGDVISDVMLQASDPLHYMTMDKDGTRPGWTSSRCPAVYQIKCGDNVAGDDIAYMLEAKNGDIVIKASNGRIRMEALDVDIIAQGPNNERGTINIRSNESINLNSKSIVCNAKSSARFLSSGVGEISFDTSAKLYFGLAKCATNSSAKNPSKYGGQSSQELVDNRYAA